MADTAWTPPAGYTEVPQTPEQPEWQPPVDWEEQKPTLASAAVQGAKTLGSNILGGLEKFGSMLKNPEETLSNLKDSVIQNLYSKNAVEQGQELPIDKDRAELEALFKEKWNRYTSWDQFKQDLATKPASVLGDLATVGGAVAGAAGMGSAGMLESEAPEAAEGAGMLTPPGAVREKAVTAARALPELFNPDAAGKWEIANKSIPTLSDLPMTDLKNTVEDLLEKKSKSFMPSKNRDLMRTLTDIKTRLDAGPVSLSDIEGFRKEVGPLTADDPSYSSIYRSIYQGYGEAEKAEAGNPAIGDLRSAIQASKQEGIQDELRSRLQSNYIKEDAAGNEVFNRRAMANWLQTTDAQTRITDAFGQPGYDKLVDAVHDIRTTPSLLMRILTDPRAQGAALSAAGYVGARKVLGLIKGE